ncbi:hypothetical protein VXC91_45085, partial [Streptomyces chiangmaiensis]|nr:hypothetical protein [Streptomyces chiangmaiensis]
MSLGFEWDFSNVVAILSVVIPLLAFVWEFGVAGRKRLGYRVQMDTPATGAGHAPSANVLAGMRVDTRSLNEPSFVLMRIENAGWVEIGESDYLAPTTNATGIWVTFPQRRVVGMAVTELSDPALRSFFITETRADDGSTETREASGFGHGEQDGAGLIKLPKVMLNKGAHYKVLAVLERKPGTSGDVPRPVFRAGVLGDGHNRWFRWLGWFARLKMARTEAHLFASRPALLGIALLTAAVLTQASLTLFWREDPPPLDCVDGTLHLHGSTAFARALEAAAEDYLDRCEGADVRIPLEDNPFKGSTEGVTELDQAGRETKVPVGEGLGDHLAFTDGLASDGHPRLIPRPVAFSVFSIVINKDAG